MRASSSRTLSAVEPDDIALVRHVTGVRRRVRRHHLARHAVVALSLAAALGSIALAWPTVIPPLVWAAAGVAVCVLAVSSAWLRTPALNDIATQVDHRLQLADAVATAMALRSNREPIARLIVRDTVARLTKERPADAFRFELGRPALVTMCAASLSVVVTLTIHQRQPSTPTRGDSSPNMASGGVVIPLAQPPADAASNDAVVQQSPDAFTGTRSMPPPSPAVSETAPQNAGDPPRGDREPRSNGSGELTRRGDGDRQPVSPADRVTNQTGTPSGASPQAQSARSGGAGSIAPGVDDSNRSGGVRQGVLQTALPPAGAPAADDYRAEYRAARTRADTAVARDEVPRARRVYVRDYFLAIAPRD